MRYERSVGEISMDVDQAPTVAKPRITGHVQERPEEDDAEHANGDNEQYDYPEETRGTKKPRKEKIDDAPFNRALPVAELPDDFDGEALDGATFLALSK